MMSAIELCWRAAALGGGLVIAMAAGGCRKRDASEDKGPPPVIAVELADNRISGLPGGVYQSQAGSPIHWQPWEKATFDRALAAQRLVFAVIALPQYGNFQGVLAELQRNPAMVADINNSYVPVLVDGDAAREIGLLTADLAVEIRRPVQLPMFLWLTPAGNPVAWIPVGSGDAGKVAELFDKSHAMVIESWTARRSYVQSNSEMDNANRRERMSRRRNADIASKDPAGDVVRAVRQLTSLYDPLSRSFDEAGGLFPTGGLEVLAHAAMCGPLPEEVRARCVRTLRELMTDLVPSAMFDPLDGGLYSSRRSVGWSLPMFERDGNRQALAVAALCRVYQATGDERVLERALGVLGYLERGHATPDGLFALGVRPPQPARNWLWTVEEVRKVLPEEDAKWWIAATGMRGLGNLPSEADPKREFFRCNSFGIGKSLAELAADAGLAPEAFAPRYEEVRKKLLAAREARLGKVPMDDQAHAVTTFRMVSAYAAAYTATGDDGYRNKAVALLKQAREVFSNGPELWQYKSRTAPSVSAGRAFLYSLALQACLDVADVTGDEKWMDWGDDLATTAAERFTSTEFLKESSDEAKVLDLPVTDLVMLFDESTAGVISSNESRMAARGRPLVDSFTALATPLPMVTLDRPVLHTDLMIATLARHYAPVVVVGKDAAPALRQELARLPLRTVNRRMAEPKDEVPPGALKILWPDGRADVVEKPEGFRDTVLPSRSNR
jgi:uncharacterized protein YyaL (SSP411 family)